jgi:hypothetical protein
VVEVGFLIWRFFFAISAFSTVPLSWSIFFPPRTSMASSASSLVRNLAKPIYRGAEK